jgi:hypothetical protein
MVPAQITRSYKMFYKLGQSDMAVAEVGIGACPHLRMPPSCAMATTGNSGGGENNK